MPKDANQAIQSEYHCYNQIGPGKYYRTAFLNRLVFFGRNIFQKHFSELMMQFIN